MAGEQTTQESPGERLERDLSEIEHLALVGPSEYGVEETLARMRDRTRAARERYDAASPDPPSE